LVITDLIQNVPKEYREVGTAILMENDRGQTKSFLVTRIDAKSITIDGNNPLCGREVIFKLEITTVRDATDEEIVVGGKVEAGPIVDAGLSIHEVTQ
jgi:FKBP-type peptidyl-prolyl cis-trans isomerase SlyD